MFRGRKAGRKLSGCLISVMLLTSSHANAADDAFQLLVIGPDTLSSEQELRVAKSIHNSTKMYIDQVKAITPFTFDNRDDISAKSAVALSREADAVEERLTELLKWTSMIIDRKDKQDAYTVYAWVQIAREIISVTGEMNDLADFRLIDSDWNIAAPLYALKVHDKLISPKLIEILSQQQVRQKIKK